MGERGLCLSACHCRTQPNNNGNPATNVLNLGGGGESGLSGVKGQEGAPNSIPRRPPKPFKKTNGVLNDSVEKVPVKVVRSYFGFNF